MPHGPGRILRTLGRVTGEIGVELKAKQERKRRSALLRSAITKKAAQAKVMQEGEGWEQVAYLGEYDVPFWSAQRKGYPEVRELSKGRIDPTTGKSFTGLMPGREVYVEPFARVPYGEDPELARIRARARARLGKEPKEKIPPLYNPKYYTGEAQKRRLRDIILSDRQRDDKALLNMWPEYTIREIRRAIGGQTAFPTFPETEKKEKPKGIKSGTLKSGTKFRRKG